MNNKSVGTLVSLFVHLRVVTVTEFSEPIIIIFRPFYCFELLELNGLFAE